MTPQNHFVLRRLCATLVLFFALALYDAVIGGAIAALLKSDGFTALDQRINNVHQLGYGLLATGALLWYYLRVRHLLPVLALAVLFAGLVEDTLFYVLISVCNPLIKTITGGARYHSAGGEWMPQEVSGWMGWIGRMAAGQNLALARSEVFAVNGIAIGLAIILLLRYARAMKPGSGS